MTFRQVPWLLAAALLSACGHGGSDVQVFGGDTDTINHHITLHQHRVAIRVASAPEAVVDASGQLFVDSKPVPVNDAQRALLQRYNASAEAMRTDAIATGKAGMATAAQALNAAAGHIIGGDGAESTKDKVEAAAQSVKQSAAKICDDLAAMKSAQDALVTQLDAFKPYGQALRESDVEQCRHDASH